MNTMLHTSKFKSTGIYLLLSLSLRNKIGIHESYEKSICLLKMSWMEIKNSQLSSTLQGDAMLKNTHVTLCLISADIVIFPHCN